MHIIQPSATIYSATPDLEQVIEYSGRLCYKSTDRMCEGSAERFIGNLMESKHESVLEHAAISVHIICDRGISHELVRHRMASYSQESTRYCNYSKDKFGSNITVIEPPFWDKSSAQYTRWLRAMYEAEEAYFAILAAGGTAQEARSVLPNSLKTEVMMTANPRQWLHVFKLRTAKEAHPQMREIMIPLKQAFAQRWPAIFSEV